MSIACVIIASAKRRDHLDRHILPSVLGEPFDEVVVVGDYHSGDGYRHLSVPPVTNSTLDALMKRDTGTVATSSEWLFYLCDDHRIVPGSVDRFRHTRPEADVIVPYRHERGKPLNMGESEGYCGGHGMLVNREVIRNIPWMVAPHHPNWDLYHSQMLRRAGYRFHYSQGGIAIEDVEYLC